MNEKEKQVSLQKFLKIMWASISLLVLIISIWIIFDCFKKTPDQEQLVLNYNSNTNLDYKVYLKPNKFYERSYLDKDKKYISNIIKCITPSFNYEIHADKNIDFNYKYNHV